MPTSPTPPAISLLICKTLKAVLPHILPHEKRSKVLTPDFPQIVKGFKTLIGIFE